MAIKRLYNMESPVSKDKILKGKYIQFMRNCEKEGHMSQIETKRKERLYYLPHHIILKDKKQQEKRRIMFDRAAKQTGGELLNSALEKERI
jgi:hypothetical protein